MLVYWRVVPTKIVDPPEHVPPAFDREIQTPPWLGIGLNKCDENLPKTSLENMRLLENDPFLFQLVPLQVTFFHFGGVPFQGVFLKWLGFRKVGWDLSPNYKLIHVSYKSNRTYSNNYTYMIFCTYSTYKPNKFISRFCSTNDLVTKRLKSVAT